MNDFARQLRAQISSSTDPERLERMARVAEGRTAPSEHPTQPHQSLAGTTRGLLRPASGRARWTRSSQPKLREARLQT